MRNGKVDPGEEPIEGAVLVLDGGERSEQVRRGAYRFDSIRSGDHVVSLLSDSLPEGAVITGSDRSPVALTRDQLSADLDFLVVIAERPETREGVPAARMAAPPPPAAKPAGRRRRGTADRRRRSGSSGRRQATVANGGSAPSSCRHRRRADPAAGCQPRASPCRSPH